MYKEQATAILKPRKLLLPSNLACVTDDVHAVMPYLYGGEQPKLVLAEPLY